MENKTESNLDNRAEFELLAKSEELELINKIVILANESKVANETFKQALELITNYLGWAVSSFQISMRALSFLRVRGFRGGL